MNSLTIAGIAGGVVLAIIAMAFWWVRRDATRAARAEMQERAEHYARQAEGAMDEEMMTKKDPQETTRRLGDGNF